MGRLKFIDTHAHLDNADFASDRDAVIARAKEAGVEKMITVGCWNRSSGFSPLTDILSYYGFVYAALGVHPHDAKDVVDDTPWESIRSLALQKNSRVVAVGETGLDYHYDNSPREAQKEVFKKQLSLARELNLPVIVHTREAEADTIELMKAEGVNETGGVFHCFSGSKELSEAALKMGFYLSFSGVVTFPKAEALREVVKTTPIEKMLIETDCPYLAPVPHRGGRNEPSFVADTARAIAGIKGLSLADVARITTMNAEDLFGLGAGNARREVKIAYPIRNSLYLNITNRCSNYCTFCAKFKSYTVKGHYLRLNEEPDFDAVIAAIGPDPEEKYDEIVFCGFGEPLLRLDLVKQVGMYLKRRGCRIRIDTDGLANLVHKRNVLPELMFVDCVSVSMNAPDSETYQRLIKTPFGDNAYPAILYFLREAKKYIAKVVASVVAVPGLDVEACRRVAEDELGVAFRVREYDTVG
ncbi:MAG: YchF/TatD family DNA exonuclease [Deltaproteobacteria bacterium]|nr:YchF/TatD family DNA exonuclease [Deltaproteobacteria bacterium]